MLPTCPCYAMVRRRNCLASGTATTTYSTRYGTSTITVRVSYVKKCQACVKRHFSIRNECNFLERAGLDRNEGLSATHTIVWEIYDVEVVQLAPRGRWGDDTTLPDYYWCDKNEAFVDSPKYAFIRYSFISIQTLSATSTIFRISAFRRVQDFIVCVEQRIWAIHGHINWKGRNE